MHQPTRSIAPMPGVPTLRSSAKPINAASSTETHWCARCKYTFEAMSPPECPLCGTQNVEVLRDPTDPDNEST